MGRVEMKPRGSQPASTTAGAWLRTCLIVFRARRHEPGPIGGSASCRR